MTNSYQLNDLYGHLPPLELKQGTAFALYVDQGPKGVCGQSCDITCPWAQLHVFDSIEELSQARIGRNGVKAFVMQGVIGEWSAPGHLTIVDHRKATDETN